MHHHHWCIGERFSLLYCASLLARQTNVTERRLSTAEAQQDSYREVGQYVKRADRFSIVGLSRTCESRVSNTSSCVISKVHRYCCYWRYDWLSWFRRYQSRGMFSWLILCTGSEHSEIIAKPRDQHKGEARKRFISQF